MKTFKLGGIHPAENKLSSGQAIIKLPIPESVIIPVSQHLGAPSKLMIKKGDQVKTGQQITSHDAFISANLHSSVSGKVLKIDDAIDSSGYKRPAIFINVEGDDWEESIDQSTEIKKSIDLSPEQIIEKIKELGIVGLGGATFPTHIKLMPPGGKKADILIINGVECEPFLTSDHQLMLEKGEEILIGTTIMMKGLHVTKAVIGIESNKPDAISHLSILAKDFDGIEVQSLKVKYPQGGEKQLIKALINREVPSGALPIEVGAVVNNVGTAFAVYEAVQKNKPLIDRIITLTGNNLKNNGNYLVRIGTSISYLFEKAGGLPENTGKIIGGGPMMGKAYLSLDVPIVKGSSGILVFEKKDSNRVKVENCIRCGKCVTVCPMGLEPYLLSNLSSNSFFEKALDEQIFNCIECGSCHYVCPSGRPLLDYIRLGKNQAGNILRKRAKN